VQHQLDQVFALDGSLVQLLDLVVVQPQGDEHAQLSQSRVERRDFVVRQVQHFELDEIGKSFRFDSVNLIVVQEKFFEGSETNENVVVYFGQLVERQIESDESGQSRKGLGRDQVTRDRVSRQV